MKYIYIKNENRIKKINIFKVFNKITGTFDYISNPNLSGQQVQTYKPEILYDDYESCLKAVTEEKTGSIRKIENLIKNLKSDLNNFDLSESYNLPEFRLEDDEMLILCNPVIDKTILKLSGLKIETLELTGITNEYGKVPDIIESNQINSFFSKKFNRKVIGTGKLCVMSEGSDRKQKEIEIIKILNGAIIKYSKNTENDCTELNSVSIDMDQFNRPVRYISADMPVMMTQEYEDSSEPVMILSKQEGKDIYIKYDPMDEHKKYTVINTPMVKLSEYINRKIMQHEDDAEKIRKEINELAAGNKEKNESMNKEKGHTVLYMGENGIERKLINGKTIGNSFWMLQDQTSSDEWNVKCIQKDLCVDAEFNPYTECSEYSDVLDRMQKEGKLSDEAIFFIKKYEQEKDKFDEYKSELRMSCYTIRDLIKNVSE